MSLIPRLFTLIGSAKSFQTTVRQAKESVATVRTLTRDAQAAVVQNDWDKACQGDPVAQNEMGERLAEGRGVPRDWASAVAWFQRSAAQGHPVAQCNLGMMLFLGRGTASDRIEGYKWISLAAEQGHAKAREIRKKAAKKMLPEEIQESQARMDASRKTFRLR